MSDTPVVLGTETSCDETGLGVVAGTTMRSNVLASQVDIHARFGGVVPMKYPFSERIIDCCFNRKYRLNLMQVHARKRKDT